ncbi:hypothetical protein [Flavobacterium sp.]|jgi:hypothetical protein|uniref:hypothetical protein n=1 Tax=Flavobacterium sp. TaxID=239 RepID=UPI00391D4EDC
MKNLLFGLIATVLFSFSGFASSVAATSNIENAEKKESAVIVFETKDSKTNYDFNSLKDFVDFSGSIIESLNELPADDSCTITISMSVTVTVDASIGVAGGSISTTVSGSITTSCEGAVAAGKKLRAQLIAMAGG